MVNVKASKTYSKQQEGKGKFCRGCTNSHALDDCKEFDKLDCSIKNKFVKGRELCVGCLKWGHTKKACRKKGHVKYVRSTRTILQLMTTMKW